MFVSFLFDKPVGFIAVFFYNALMYSFYLCYIHFTYVLIFLYLYTHFYSQYSFLFDRPVGFIDVCFYIVVMFFFYIQCRLADRKQQV